MNYYDLILGLIPLALIGIAATLTFGGFTLTTAVTMGGTVSAGAIGHAMFVNPPVDPESAIPGRSTDF